MKKCKVGGQAVMEGVMMKSPAGIAMAVRKSDGTIVTEFKTGATKAQKGTFLGLPVVRGVVVFVESLVTGMNTLTRSAELAGEEIDEEPTKFEKWLAKKLGKTADKVVMGIAMVIAIAMAVGLFFILPTLVSTLIFGANSTASQFAKSITEGGVRLVIFIGYILFCSCVKDVKRVFMYHGAEHKTIACYEAEEALTPENAAKHSRLHPRCGTNYLFLVMAVSILFFAAIGFSDNLLIRFATRIVFIPVVAGLSYEVLQLAAKHDNFLTKIIRAPGMALQYITTKEPTLDMLEVAIESFKLAMSTMPAEEQPILCCGTAAAGERADNIRPCGDGAPADSADASSEDEK